MPNFTRFLRALAIVPALGPLALAACGDGSSEGKVKESDGPDAGVSSGDGDASTGADGSDENIDYTMCEERACDPDAELPRDFAGVWVEDIVFTSNDCDPGLQSLIPPGFTQEGATFTDVIEGNCVRPEPGSNYFAGSIATDLSGAEYCGISKLYVESQMAELGIINHVKWTSIGEDKIVGTVDIYIAEAGCVLHGDYTLTRPDGGS